jgi:hypothetical protein
VRVALAAAVALAWQAGPPVPVPRTEVAAAVAGKEIAVAGGYLADGSSTARTDLYDPARRTWRRGPDLPEAVNHAAAASLSGTAVVAGGYASGGPVRTAVALVGGRWRTLPPLPAPRAAAAAVVLGGRLYVVGGVAAGGLAQNALEYDPKLHRWRFLPGPAPRQHLAAAVAGGRVYAIGGRIGGADSNQRTVESWAPGERRWRAEPDLPEAWGGTGAATVGTTIVSVGGEAPQGTRASVHAFETTTGTWRRLDDLPTPRHGLGVVALGGRVYTLAGGPQPGITVTGANESLRVP